MPKVFMKCSTFSSGFDRHRNGAADRRHFPRALSRNDKSQCRAVILGRHGVIPATATSPQKPGMDFAVERSMANPPFPQEA
jgi:hypothetical protein